MRKLKKTEISKVCGAGIWDDFWQGVGRWIADQSYSEENMRIMNTDPEIIRQEYPNDPLL